MSDLVQRYEKSLPIWIDEDGFPRPPLLALHHNGEITMASMMIPPGIVFTTAMRQFMADISVKEIIFGVDRYTQPGQGTKYADVLTVFWWQGERVNEHYGWRFGVVNYCPPPHMVIEPIDWSNKFWNDIMLKIVQEYYGNALREVASVVAKPGGEELIKRLRRAVAEGRKRHLH